MIAAACPHGTPCPYGAACAYAWHDLTLPALDAPLPPPFDLGDVDPAGVAPLTVPSFEETRELAKRLPPMTEAEKFAQDVSWVYGQVKLSGSPLSREQVEEVVRRARDGKGGAS